jgi:hypothetical protein
MNRSPRTFSGLFRCGLLVIFGVGSMSAVGWGEVRQNPLRAEAGARPAPTRATPRAGTAAPPAATPQPAATIPPKAEERLQATEPVAAASQVGSGVRPAVAVDGVSGGAVRPTNHAVRMRQPSYVPPHESVMIQEGMVSNGELLTPTVPGPPVPDEILFDSMGPVVGGKGCGKCTGKGCNDCCLIPCPPWSLDNVELFVGAQGFNGPVNRGGSSSFGFHEGINWGLPMPCTNGLFGLQVGARTTQSNLSGAAFAAETFPAAPNFYSDGRYQFFGTAGLFRRVDWGLQGGVVFDILSDNWYTSTTLTQVRGELSWVFPCSHELGFWATASGGSDTQETLFDNQQVGIQETWEPTDLFAFFYRHRSSAVPGAEGRIYAGFSGSSDGLVGLDWRLPLSESVALETGFNYLVPQESNTGTFGGGHETESWNMGISLVWYPGHNSPTKSNYFRPLFNVADNGTFKVDRVPNP